MKKIFFVLCAMGIALSTTAQSQINLQPGDSVLLSRECKTYLTGQSIPNWVYDLPMTVMQVGGKTYPNGILLKEVISWVNMEAVGAKYVNDNEVSAQPEPAPVPVVEPEPAPAPAPVVEPEPEPVVEPQPQPQPVVEPEPQPQPVAEVLSAPKMNQHRLGIGVRLGAASLMQSVDNKNIAFAGGSRDLGGVAALDIEYTFLSKLKSCPSVALGLKTGVSAAYAHNVLYFGSLLSQYTQYDNEVPSNKINYTVSADKVRELNSQLMVEVPLLFAFRHASGFVFALGPKFNMPVYGWYKTTYQNPHIIAYYEDMGVAETDQLITGKLSGVAAQADKQLKTAQWNILWNLELGYDWTLKNNNALSLMIYGDAPIYSSYQKGTGETNFIQVSVPKAGGPDIKTHSIMNSYGNGWGYLDCGIKLIYHFCFEGKK